MTVFFTADTHFGHARIIELCKRPFATVEEMDEVLVERWNQTVGRNDTVFLLGDFTLKNGEAAWEYISKLNGEVHLIHGNHDRLSVRTMGEWASSFPVREISHQGKKITLCHYAMRVWNESHLGALMFYGHSHGTLPGNSQSLDVGVDCWGFRPVTLDEILDRMAMLEPYRAGQ